MKKNYILKILHAIILLFFANGFSQVGIGTTNPQETLHINGTVRIENTTSNTANSNKLIGLDANGTINEVQVGNNLSLVNGVLSSTVASATAGATNYGIAIITGNFANRTLNNYNLDLQGANSNKTLFIFRQSPGSPQAVTITGIAGGTDGRVIILKTDSNNFNINLTNQSNNSIAANRFKLVNSTNVNGYGSITLVYVGEDSRWQMINREL